MKSDYEVKIATVKEVAGLLSKYHYIHQEKDTFKSGINFGLYHSGEIVGVCIYNPPPTKEVVWGMIGTTDQSGVYELSRLCLEPTHQETEHNLASWFVARTIRAMKKREIPLKAIMSYADAKHHTGIVYRALGFEYYGTSKVKKDFWIKKGDTYVKHVRGPMKGLEGEWRDRTIKHRFLMVFDKNIKVYWSKQ